ncbi:MAG TPA: basic amino acid/polyamine antiporter [Myxococcota bacterium]|nr:basic amino acid/polyamine antiporter [Myxococcota bacterium]
MSAPDTQKLPVRTLTAMVVGGMVGAGVFSIPRNFAQATGVYGALIAWAIAGAGMLMLAFVFQTLANRKPDLDAGVYAYARAGFGPYLGFFSAFGYWASACVGNVSYWILIMSTLGAVFPILGKGNTLVAVLISSVGIWAFHFLVLRGVKEAAGINRVVTIAKIIPLLLFVVLAIFYFKLDVFVANLWGGSSIPQEYLHAHGDLYPVGAPAAALYGHLFEQVKATMLVTVFVFLGIEGASNYSRFAQRREDVGIATVTGFVGVLALFTSVSILSYAILPRAEIAQLRQPSVGGVLEAAVGPWGAVFIGAGLIVSVLGAYLAWTLMAAEVLSIAAKKQDMPAFLARENANEVPSSALLMSTLLVQLVLLATLFSDDAFTFALSLCSHLSLIPYFLSAAFALKLVWTRETYERDSGDLLKDLLIAILATVYTIFLLFAGGWKFLVLGFLIYAPGTALYYMTRRELGKRLFTLAEGILFAVAVVLAVYAVHGLVTGYITI